jgi:UDP-glucose 4-epimerase
VKRVLVTGGAGFIGSHVVERLVDEGLEVRVLDNLSSGSLDNLAHHKDNSKVEVVIGDLKRMEDVARAVEGMDVVFHFAANPEVRVSAINPEIHFNENVVATFNLLEAIRRRGVKEMIFASSSSVYGEPDEIPDERGSSREARVRLRGQQGGLREPHTRLLEALRNQSRGPEVRERRGP